MSKEQIEEMAKVIKSSLDGLGSGKFIFTGDEISIMFAKALYTADYRKQSEPISCGHEKSGEWVRLPCKVGDTLYVISQMKDKRFLPFINEYEVTSVSVKKKSIVIYHEMDGYIKTFKEIDFGKTVFLSKAEAEAKMKGE